MQEDLQGRPIIMARISLRACRGDSLKLLTAVFRGSIDSCLVLFCSHAHQQMSTAGVAELPYSSSTSLFVGDAG